MALEVKIHAAQTAILRELLFHPSATFAKLQKPTKLTSDHFNFHIGRLVELGFVAKKDDGHYKLTSKGKEYANKLDTDSNTIERQPKIAVILAIERQRDGKTEYLFQQRLKNPYYGFWGFPTGKMRWGETIEECAHRECMEETNLTADFEVKGVYHERVRLTSKDEFVEDKMFFVVHGLKPKGKLMADFEGGHNEWMTFEEMSKNDKKFDSYKAELDILSSDEWLIERKVDYDDDHF